MNNKHMNKAKVVKNDEFYTLYKDIEEGLKHYEPFFEGKKILLPFNDAEAKCDNFFTYFVENFNRLKLKEVVAFSYDNNYAFIYDGKNGVPGQGIYKHLESGDYSHPTNRKYFEDADLVVSNPPFSILKSVFNFFDKNNVKYIIIAPFLSIRNGRYIRKNYFYGNTINNFYNKNDKLLKVNCRGFSNFNVGLKLKKLPNFKKMYELFNNNNKSNVSDCGVLFIDKIKNIPNDYNARMLVPITFLLFNYHKKYIVLSTRLIVPKINGKSKFDRILIQKKEINND